MLDLKIYTPKYLLCIFKNPVTVHKDNQGEISLMVDPQMQPHTNHIAIKSHTFYISITKVNVDIKHVDTK